jgi:hypothetical protein
MSRQIRASETILVELRFATSRDKGNVTLPKGSCFDRANIVIGKTANRLHGLETAHGHGNLDDALAGTIRALLAKAGATLVPEGSTPPRTSSRRP